MLFYFIVFTVVGFVIEKLNSDEKQSFVIIVGIGIVWGIAYAPVWGLASFGEMALGYFLSRLSKNTVRDN